MVFHLHHIRPIFFISLFLLRLLFFTFKALSSIFFSMHLTNQIQLKVAAYCRDHNQNNLKKNQFVILIKLTSFRHRVEIKSVMRRHSKKIYQFSLLFLLLFFYYLGPSIDIEEKLTNFIQSVNFFFFQLPADLRLIATPRQINSIRLPEPLTTIVVFPPIIPPPLDRLNIFPYRLETKHINHHGLDCYERRCRYQRKNGYPSRIYTVLLT